MKKTIRFLITGVGGQGTILASDILAEVGLRLGHDAKKSDILGLAVRGGSVVSHIIWGENVRAPMIDRGTADYYLSFEWLEGLRRLVYTNKDTVVLANDWRIDPVSVSSGQADYPDEDGIRAAIRERCAGLREIPATPLAVEMGNARVFNSVIKQVCFHRHAKRPFLYRSYDGNGITDAQRITCPPTQPRCLL